LVAHTYSNGYDGLFAIITRDHPNVVEYPEDPTHNLPYQENHQTIHEYHEEFMNVCYLRTVFPGHTILSEPTLVTHFIAGCQHSNYLRMRSRIDHLDSSKLHIFSLAQVHFTMTQYM
jgi:hypothetical protein